MKPIRLSAHALSYIDKRGFTVAEVEEAIRETPWQPAELGAWSAVRLIRLAKSGTRSCMRQRKSVRYSLSNLVNCGGNGLYLFLLTGDRMKISYDSEVDALSITFRETTVTTKHLGEGIAADYDADGKLAGIEILDAIKRFGGKDTLRQVVIEGLGPTQIS